MKILSKQRQGELYAILSGFSYGFVGYFGMSIINSGLSVFNMLFWRFLVATLFVLIILAPQYRTVLKISKEGLKMLFYGMVFYGASTSAYFLASRYIGSGLAMVIFFVFPALVVLLNIIINKTKISKIYYLAFLIIIIGMLCLVDLHEITVDFLGIGLALLSALLYACYVFASKKIIVEPKFCTLMVSAGCMLTSLMIAIFDASLYIPIGDHTWVNIIGMGIICTALPIILLLQALKFISSEKASILSVLEPVFGVVFGITLLNEKVTSFQIIGAAVILTGALMTMLLDNPQKSIKK